MAPTRAALAALKRLDTIVAAALVAIGLMPVPAGWLCADASCSSTADTMILVAFTVGSAIVITALLWRTTRGWWTRVLALPLAAYGGVQLQAVLAHHGSWALVGEVGARCVVRGGAPQDEVRRACGAPTYWCEGPKFIESAGSWNPMSMRMGSEDLSLDAPTRAEDDSAQARVDRLASAAPAADEHIGDEELPRLFRQKLEAFARAVTDERERAIFEQRLLPPDGTEPLTLQEIGSRFNLTRERARQIEAGLTARLREYLQTEIPDFELLGPPE